MASEWDRKVMPGFMQSAFSIWLGAVYQGFEVMKSPIQSMTTFTSEAKTLLTIPPDAGEGLQKKAEAVAAVWMEKGAKLIEQLKSTGQKFTDGS